MTAAAWHPDPTGRHELRYWDGSQWTDHVADNGAQGVDPLHGPGPEQSEASPADEWIGGESAAAEEEEPAAESVGTPFDAATMVARPAAEEPAAEEPAADEPVADEPAAAPEPMAAQPPAYVPQQPAQQPYAQQPYPGQGAPGASPDAVPAAEFGGISGELIDGRFGEVGGAGPVRQNARMLRVRITEPFMSKQGAMVAYQGAVNFNYQGGGAGKFLKKAFTGEGLSLMRVEGQGDVFLADGGKHVHILHLTNSGISVNGQSVLAFSASLEWNVERVKGGSIAAGGLFNTTLRGTGWVAITTDGDPVVLNPAEAPTFADAQALVAWSVHLQTSINSSFTAGSLVGRGSGEAFQVAFHGPGFVIVQPSENGAVPPHSH